MTESRPIVLLTGASGFSRSAPVTALLQGGWSVRRVLRTGPGGVDDVFVETIGPATDWRAALAGVEAVVHLAARVHRDFEDHDMKIYRDINIEGTLQLARCAAEVGVREFIFVSTVLVNGRSNDGCLPFSEEDVLKPLGIYGMSKAAAEAGLRALAQDSGMRITIIKRPLIRSRREGEFQSTGQHGEARHTASVCSDPQSSCIPVGRKSCIVCPASAFARGQQV